MSKEQTDDTALPFAPMDEKGVPNPRPTAEDQLRQRQEIDGEILAYMAEMNASDRGVE